MGGFVFAVVMDVVTAPLTPPTISLWEIVVTFFLSFFFSVVLWRVDAGGVGVVEGHCCCCDKPISKEESQASFRRAICMQCPCAMTMSMYLTPRPKPPQNPPTAPQGVDPPIGRVACSVINLSLCVVERFLEGCGEIEFVVPRSSMFIGPSQRGMFRQIKMPI